MSQNNKEQLPDQLTFEVNYTIEAAQKVPTVSGTAYSGGPLRFSGQSDIYIDISTLAIPSSPIPFLYDPQTGGAKHNRKGEQIGSIEASVSGNSVRFQGVLDSAMESVQHLVSRSKLGITGQVSVGVDYKSNDAVWHESGETFIANGETKQGPAWLVRNGTLKELSHVPVGADAGNTLTISASAGQQNPEQKGSQDMEPENTTPVVESQHQNTNPTPAVNTTEQPAVNQMVQASASPPQQKQPVAPQPVTQPVPAPAVQIPVQQQQQPAVNQTVSASGNQWVSQLGTASNPVQPLANEPDVNMTICASLAETLGVPLKELEGKEFRAGHQVRRIDQRTLDNASSSRFRCGGSMHRIIAQTLEASGISTSGMFGRDMSEALSDVWHHLNASGAHSTNPLTDIFTAAIGYAIERPYEDALDIWPELVSQRQIKAAYLDYPAYSAIPVGKPEEVPINDQVKYVTFDETKQTVRARRYAAAIGVDEIHIDQDELGLLMDSINEFRESMNLTLNEVFWYKTFFPAVEDGTFFAASHTHTRKADGTTFDMGSNLMTEQFSEGSLDHALLLVSRMKDIRGEKVKVNRPTRLLVYSGIEASTRRFLATPAPFMNSQMLANIYHGNFEVLTSGYFDELVERGIATVPWLVFSTTANKSLFVQATVNGRSGVRVRRFDMGPSRFGFNWVIDSQFGFAPKNWQQGVFSKGDDAPLAIQSLEDATEAAAVSAKSGKGDDSKAKSGK